ncbi:MAG TPA: ABC transporter ATP-binding protein, partial [Chloroflexota bacterium]
MMEDRYAVVVQNLVKSYVQRTVVDGVSFCVEIGEVFGVLGPNGAGKTTTLEILEGYRRRDEGVVRVLGHDPMDAPGSLKARLGGMPQEGGLYPAITPVEALSLFARFYPRPRMPEEILRLVGMEESAHTRYRRLSGGQKQRLSLALALVGSPELVFLDEPTSGMDPQARRATWELIASLRRQGVTVLLTTHYMEEAESLCDRVALLHQGRVVALGRPADLVRSERPVVTLRTTSPANLDDLLRLPAAISAARLENGSYL